MSLTFTIHTLGCKVNQYDSERLAAELCKFGFKRKQFGEIADICILNTCAVTKIAEQKSRKAVSKARRLYQGSTIVALGCAVKLHHLTGGKGFFGADIALGVEEPTIVAQKLLRIANRIKPTFERIHNTEGNYHWEDLADEDDEAADRQLRVRANLKVQDGCERMCAYCVVPFLRGKPRSRPVEEVIAEARELIANGCKEIVLTGVCLGSYGRDLESAIDIVELIERICGLDGLIRLRLSSIDPRDVSERLIKTAASCEKVCPHFHISLQSGDDGLLEAMNRGYTTAQYERIVNSVREAIADVAITTDVLVGFPGETREQFENTLKFIERMEFARVHVFKFSPRPFTKASSMQLQVSANEVAARMKAMLTLAEELSYRFKEKFIGRELDVLIEEAGGTYSKGLTGNYICVRIEGVFALGDVVKVRLCEAPSHEFAVGQVAANCSKLSYS